MSYIGEDIASKILSYSVLPKYARVSKVFAKSTKQQKIEIEKYLDRVFPGWQSNESNNFMVLNITALKGDWDIFRFVLNNSIIDSKKYRKRLYTLFHLFNRWDILNTFCKEIATKFIIISGICEVPTSTIPGIYYLYHIGHKNANKFLNEYIERMIDKHDETYTAISMSGYLHPKMRLYMESRNEYRNILKYIDEKHIRFTLGYERTTGIISHEDIIKSYDPSKSFYTYTVLRTYRPIDDDLEFIATSNIITPDMLNRARTLVKQQNVDLTPKDTNPVLLYMLPEIRNLM